MNLPDAPDAEIRAALGAHYARPGEAPEAAFLKAPLHRLCCLGLLSAERPDPDEPWRVRYVRAATLADHDEADLLARFDRALQGGPLLVGFNTSGFDIPVLRYRAMALGVPLPHLHGAAGAEYLHRFGRAHLDLMDRLSGFRASPAPSLAECCALLGLPLKAEMDGERVEALWQAGDHARIAAYCRADVAATWLVLLRWWVATGSLPPDHARDAFRAFAASIEEGAFGEGLSRHAEVARALG
ncbi:MAG TPA: ribonuclease H-like domain-containing protein [Roseococcus sp.]|nr:ribonuclease H-like domain-containing protein [Roseococcus sp.]